MISIIRERKTELTIPRACVASIVRLAFLDQLRKPVDVLCKSLLCCIMSLAV